jgi:hypothetical protein
VLFISRPTSLNRLRVALEFLFDELEIPRTKQGKKGEYFLSFSDRLNSLDDNTAGYSEYFKATQILGNSGSHANPFVDASEVFDVFELFEGFLESLYSRKKELLDAIAAKVLKNSES